MAHTHNAKRGVYGHGISVQSLVCLFSTRASHTWAAARVRTYTSSLTELKMWAANNILNIMYLGCDMRDGVADAAYGHIACIHIPVDDLVACRIDQPDCQATHP